MFDVRVARVDNAKDTGYNLFFSVDVDLGVAENGHGLTVFVDERDGFFAGFFDAGFGVCL